MQISGPQLIGGCKHFTITLGLPEGMSFKVSFSAPERGVLQYEVFDERGASMGCRSYYQSGYSMRFELADDLNVLLEEHGKQINALNETFGILCNKMYGFCTSQYGRWDRDTIDDVVVIIN